MAEWKKIDASTFTGFSVSGDKKSKKDVDLSYFDDPGIIEPFNVHQSPFDIGTIPADMVRSEDDWEHKTYPGTLWPDPRVEKKFNAWCSEQLRTHTDYAAAARMFCPAGKEFLYMLPTFPILKTELSRLGSNMNLAYLDAQSIGARIREGLYVGYRDFWKKGSAEELICGWYGLIYYYGIAPQYHLRVVAEEMADYMKSRQDVTDLCESVD